MPGDNDVTRRAVLRSSAVAAGLGGVGSVSARRSAGDGGEGPEGFERLPCVEVDDRTDTVEPMAVPEQARGIRPGSQMLIEYPDGTTAGCSANFIWREAGSGGGPGNRPDHAGGPPEGRGPPHADDGSLYIGAAGHCFLADGADADEDAARDYEQGYDVSQLNVKVCGECVFGGATGLIVVEGDTIELGEVAYARQTTPEQEGGAGVGHDFGVVEIPEDAADLVDPSVPQWGGPTGVTDTAVPNGEPVHQYGAGVGNGEVFATMGTTGVSRGDNDTYESWYAAFRSTPGDSGSLLVSSDPTAAPETGEDAAGVLTHISWTLPPDPDPGEVGIAGTTIGRCKEMAAQDVGLDLEVVTVADGEEEAATDDGDEQGSVAVVGDL